MKKEKKVNTKSWKGIKDEVYGKKGAPRRDELERSFELFKVGLCFNETKRIGE